LNPNPILKVLSTFQTNRVRALLIGGQACVLYGAIQFSRDSDFVLLVTPANLKRLRAALEELQAEPIFFPPLKADYLRRGHACHFRCHAQDVEGLRVDVMARLRGCDDFAALWRRRATIVLPDGTQVEVLSVRDLVQSKKTQRDKDWLMLRRLVDDHIAEHRKKAKPQQIRWWLLECRSVENLMALSADFRRTARRCVKQRPLLTHALAQDAMALVAALMEEERLEREADRAYWKPLREELEQMRRQQARKTEERKKHNANKN
jgi:hypothetical protein